MSRLERIKEGAPWKNVYAVVDEDIDWLIRVAEAAEAAIPEDDDSLHPEFRALRNILEEK